MASSAAITLIPSMSPGSRRGAGTTAATGSVMPLRRLAKQSGRLDEENDHHDHKDDRVRRFGIEHLGQALDDAQAEARQYRTEKGAHAADDHYREDNNNQIRAHQRVHL